jgi:hypothetical protein
MHASIKNFRSRFRKFQEQSREPGLTALLIVQVALIFLVIPLASMREIPEMVVPGMFVLLVIATLVVTSRSHVAVWVVLISVLLSPFGVMVHAEHPSVVTEWLSAGGRLLAIAAVSIVIARAVFGGGRVTLHRVQGAIVLYLNFALFFFTLYRLIAVLVPAPEPFHYLLSTGTDNNSGATLLYFSFTTLTTLGYGDVLPVHQMARTLANLEAVIGQLYPATLLARLVSLELEHRRQSKSG